MRGTGIDMKDLLDSLTVEIEGFQRLAAVKKGVILDKETKVAKGHAKEVLTTAKKLKRVVWINQFSMLLVCAFNMIVVLSIVVAMNNLVSTRPLGSTWAVPVMVTVVILANIFAGRVVRDWVIYRTTRLKEDLLAQKKMLEAIAVASKKEPIS